MSSNTPNLNLLKKNPVTDGDDTFNISTMLNENWDKTDAKFGATIGHGHTGVVGDGPKIAASGLANGAATDIVIGNRTITDTTAPTGDTAAPTTLFSWLGYMIKSITGGATWRTAPGMTIAAIKTILDAAVSIATPSTLIKRDAAGRAQVATPAAAGDIARKDTVDVVQTNLTTHTAVTATGIHGSAAAATPSTLMHRDAAGSTGVVNLALNDWGRIAGLSAMGAGGQSGIIQMTNDSTTAGGYGAWVCYNCYYNGTSWVQPRGSLGSFAYSVNYHRNFSWRFAAAGGVDGGLITLVEVATMNSVGEFSAGKIISKGRVEYGADLTKGALSYGAGAITLEALTANTGILLKPTGTGAVSTAAQIVSTLATGTPPLAVASTTEVANFNASRVGGYLPFALFKIKGQILAGTDYNTLVEPGSYEIFGATGINLSPIAYGVLDVTVTVDGYIVQVATGVSGTYVQCYRARNETVWSAWKKVITDADTITTATANTVVLRDATGNIFATTLEATNPNNINATAKFGYNLDIPRIRIGGSGAGSGSPFEIQGLGDAVMMSLSQAGVLTAKQFVSNIAQGTPPLVVTSTTTVPNLSATFLGGMQPSSSNVGSTIVMRDASGNISVGAISAQSLGVGATGITSSGVITLTNTLNMVAGAPIIRMTESDQALDEKVWMIVPDGKGFEIRTLTDAFGTGSTAMKIQRGTGTAITNVQFPSVAVYAGTFTSTAAQGVAPLAVASTTAVPNLNVDLHDGYHAMLVSTASSVPVRDANKKIAEVAANRVVTGEIALGTTLATVATFTAPVAAAYTVKMCLRVAAAVNVAVNVVYTGPGGAKTEVVVPANTAFPIGDHYFIPVMFRANAGTAVSVTANASSATSAYVTSIITEEG